jgi:hypothetical protein
MCKFLVYGQNNSMEKRYIIGNAFLRSYYVMLNYTSDILGFNGEYSEVKKGGGGKPPVKEDKASPLTIILIIAGALLFVAIGVCLLIKKRNESINAELSNNAKYHSIDQ